MNANEIKLEIGGKYENVKGVYEVITIDPDNDSMVIRWENGEEIESSIKLQQRIIKRLMFEKKREEEQGQEVNHYTLPKSAGSEFKGFVESDFKNNVTGTNWRGRNSLGGAVTRHLFSKKFTFISNAVYRVPMTQWADINHRGSTDDASEQAKFFVQAHGSGLKAGFYIEHPAEPTGSKVDWNALIEWLGEKENEKWLNELSEQDGLSIKIDEWHDDKMISDAYLKPEKGIWKKDNESVNSIIPFLNELNPAHWVGLYIHTEMDKEYVIARQKDIAIDISEKFEALMPLYEASTTHLNL